MSVHNIGYAVARGDGIDISTVSPTQIGAMVNWLTVELEKIIHPSASEEAISECFTQLAAVRGARLIRVQCTEIKGNGQ